MKPPLLLKTILDIFLFLLMMNIAASVVFIIYFWLFSDGSIPLDINGKVVEVFDAVAIAFIALVIISKLVFVRAVFKLHTLVKLFFQKKIYTRSQVAALKSVGWLFIISKTVEILAGSTYVAINRVGPINVKLVGVGSFDSFWFVISLGLFFIFLSRVFDNARVLKEENELTV